MFFFILVVFPPHLCVGCLFFCSASAFLPPSSPPSHISLAHTSHTLTLPHRRSRCVLLVALLVRVVAGWRVCARGRLGFAVGVGDGAAIVICSVGDGTASVICSPSVEFAARHVMSCHVMSCHVMSCHVMSCRVVSCLVVSCRVLSCLVASRRVASCRVVSCRLTSYHVWS